MGSVNGNVARPELRGAGPSGAQKHCRRAYGRRRPPDQITRLTWFITDREAYLANRKDIGVSYREIIGRHFPAMSVLVVNGLIEDGAQVEIEATAVIPDTAE